MPEENVALPEGQPTSQDLAQQQELLRQQQHGLLQRMPLQSRPPAQAAWQTVKTSWLQNTPNTTVNSTSPTNALSPNASGESNAATAIGNDALLDHLALTDFAEVHLCHRQVLPVFSCICSVSYMSHQTMRQQDPTHFDHMVVCRLMVAL